ncbi:T9SS type A sorting domain-containing protein [Paraflavitalea pollutisoli]|uniref:T9SS type A sorting domain-containing protein n=1 Tax=Paraflavitalea pollutisoli TaxID=3034143 RepID=UPI0023ED19B6|nr:T9SS type A sorting domain-containing protein [Paraflavitalea sp. H1-2-19X]
MKQSYPKQLISSGLIFLITLTTAVSAVAQCPSGSVAPVANTTYTNGQVVCISTNYSGNLQLNNGAKMVIVNGGHYSGSLTAIQGSTVEVRDGGNFTPSGGNFSATVTVGKDANVTLSGINPGNGFTIINSGKLFWPNNINLNNAFSITNTSCGTMRISPSLNLSKSGTTIQNSGTMVLLGGLETSSGVSIDNRGQFIVAGDTKLAGSFKNQWKAVFKGASHTFNSGDSIINLYTMVFGGSVIGAPRVRNEGLLWFAGAFQYNGGGGIKNNRTNAQLRVGGSFVSNGAISGFGSLYTGGSFLNQGTITGLSSTQRIILRQSGGGTTSNTSTNSAMAAEDTLTYAGGAGNPDASCLALLPMVLSNFKGMYTEGAVDLSWTTLSETNAKQFVVEVSTDGIYYTQVGTVVARGNNVQGVSYQYRYSKEMYPTLYFRLLLVDQDGRTEYSSVVSIRTATKQSISAGVYPNPFVEKLVVNVTIPRAAAVSLRLLDMNGRVIKTQDHAGQAGINKWQLIGLTDLGKGLYLLEVTAGEDKWLQKIIK